MPEPTTAQKEAYAKSLLDLAKRFDNLDHETVKRLVGLLQETRRGISDVLAAGPSSFEQARLTQLRASIDGLIRNFEIQLQSSLTNALNAADDIGIAAVVEPLQAAGVLPVGQFNTIATSLLNVTADFSAELVKNIGDDMRARINAQLRLAALGQESPFQAMKRVTGVLGVKARDGVWGTRNRPEVVSGVAARAEAIVRTEMTRMHNLGHFSQQQVTAKSVPGLRKRWLATGDSRTRRSHLAAHRRTYSQPIPIDQKFKVGNAELLFPGDPRGPAEETIHCRCRTITVHPDIGVVPTPGDDAINDEIKERGGKVGLGEPAAPLPRKAEPPKEPEPDPRLSRDFPDDLNDIKTIKPLGGSTGAELVEDTLTGKRFVMKRGGSPEHLKEEMAADDAYLTLGVKVPKYQRYTGANGEPVKIAEFIEGQTYKDLLASGDKKKLDTVNKRLRKDFGADALLGNWDVMGLGNDNILIDAKGVPWRIDNGGALRYRAQGRTKDTLGKMAEFDAYPNELWTLRDQGTNKQTAAVFGDISWADIDKQMKSLNRKKKKLLDALPRDLRTVVEARIAAMQDMTKITKTFRDDDFVDQYIDGFLRHSIGLRKQGIIDNLPKQLKHQGVAVRDENNLSWDHLRGRGSIIHDVRDYINANGGDYGMVDYWMGRQAGSSWSGASQALKYKIALDRGGNFDRYYWHQGVDAAKKHYEGALNIKGAAIYNETFQAFHAWNYEFLRNVKFDRNKKSFVELVRTEAKSILSNYNISPGDKDVRMLRGAAESASIFEAIRAVAGGEVTIQRVPHHRILGIYFQERSPGTSQSAFLGDNENEFVFIPEGIPFDYVDSIYQRTSAAQYWK